MSIPELLRAPVQRRRPKATRRAALVTLALRVILEVGIVAALGYWGLTTGGGTWGKIVLGVGAPLLGFGFWGAVDFRGAGWLAEPLRLLQELVISALAAVAAYLAGQPAAGVALGALSLAYHLLVYAVGDTLLKPRS